jgi:hypothetical protein
LKALSRFEIGTYDVIITDHRMGGMTDLQFAEQINARDLAQTIILLSGSPPFPETSAFVRQMTDALLVLIGCCVHRSALDSFEFRRISMGSGSSPNLSGQNRFAKATFSSSVIRS